jgi:hypothetical protein
MPTWNFGPWWAWALWNALGFACCVVWCSFAEFILHRFVMHRKGLLSFPYELHAVGHHTMFRADETYHAQDEAMKEHVTFVPRDYGLLLLANLPLWAITEWACGRPVMVGCFVATFGYLAVFDLLHWRWHVPSDTWLQRTRLFLWMKERHRIHHGDQGKNFNLVVPLADILLGTFEGPGREWR